MRSVPSLIALMVPAGGSHCCTFASYSPFWFHHGIWISGAQAVRHSVQGFRCDVPAGVKDFPFKSIVVTCPLCGEQRQYLPSEPDC